MLANNRREHMLVGLEQGTRNDGRNLEDYRDVAIEVGVSATADGSARVKIGNTEVIAGVKLSLETPYSDTPDRGNLMVNVELLPLASPDFESGPPTIESIELARVTDRAIRESDMIDVHKLCVKEGEQVWSVIIDICTINHDGNLFDAANVAALAAIRNARFPAIDENGKVDYKNKTDESLPVEQLALSVTVHKIGDFLIVDPNKDEELASEARLTVASLDDGTLCALQKGGEGALDPEYVGKMIDLAVERAHASRRIIKEL